MLNLFLKNSTNNPSQEIISQNNIPKTYKILTRGYFANKNYSFYFSVLIRNLPINVNEMFIRELFVICGQILSLEVYLYYF